MLITIVRWPANDLSYTSVLMVKCLHDYVVAHSIIDLLASEYLFSIVCVGAMIERVMPIIRSLWKAVDRRKPWKKMMTLLAAPALALMLMEMQKTSPSASCRADALGGRVWAPDTGKRYHFKYYLMVITEATGQLLCSWCVFFFFFCINFLTEDAVYFIVARVKFVRILGIKDLCIMKKISLAMHWRVVFEFEVYIIIIP